MQPWLEGWMEKVSQGSLRRRRSLVVFDLTYSQKVVQGIGYKHLRRSWKPGEERPERRPMFFLALDQIVIADISYEG